MILSNTAASKLIKGTISIPHPYGRLQFGKDLDLLFHIFSETVLIQMLQLQ
jgi:(2R)-sulfolactate sulfo-lyase subunit beta